MKLNWVCAPIDYSDTPHNMFVLKLCYIYFLMKVTDLLDTVFFLLRKKENQASFLHVYHHFGMILLSWTGVRFLGGGHSIFLGVINSFVHTIMYFYYLLTVWQPEYKKSIWWKKHITHLQLLQFIFLFFMYGQLLMNADCTYPKIGSYFVVPQSIAMIFLFSDFYWKAYIKPNRK
ncbi:elongation of very long chain fatty acids protein 7, partial [Asbolus verrucosus]